MQEVSEHRNRVLDPISLENFNTFISHSWITSVMQNYDRDSVLAQHALYRLTKDLRELNEQYSRENGGRQAFTAIDGRVKSRDSFLRKLYNSCCERVHTDGITQTSLRRTYSGIKDLCGVRISCPYFDEVKPFIAQLIRPRLGELGYGTNISGTPYRDKDYLDEGDTFGYRSYHFFVKVPTFTDIFGRTELFLCEVQARSELQHVWAVKSHDLLYKHEEGWSFSDDQVREDMRQLSNSLRTADQWLVSIRERTRGGLTHEQ